MIFGRIIIMTCRHRRRRSTSMYIFLLFIYFGGCATEENLIPQKDKSLSKNDENEVPQEGIKINSNYKILEPVQTTNGNISSVPLEALDILSVNHIDQNQSESNTNNLPTNTDTDTNVNISTTTTTTTTTTTMKDSLDNISSNENENNNIGDINPKTEFPIENKSDIITEIDTTTIVDSTVNPIVLTRPPLAPWEYQEKLLLNALMKDYERDIRPVRNASRPVLIEVGITLTQIFDMDEKNQVLTTNVWLDQEWYDELLRWDPKDYGGLSSIRLPCERIWLPDIVLYNKYADDYARGYMPSRAMVGHDGKVFWPPPTKFRSTCPVDVTYFPFDDQICTLKLGSWTYDGFQVDVTNRTSEVDLSNYVRNGEWELLEAALQRNVVFYSCCPEPFPDVTITLIIRRKTLYYVYNVVAPCCMLSILTLLVFCLPPDSGEKVALGITVLLAFSVFMLAIAEKMPETSESIPLIGIYLTAVMAITSISVIVTVVVLNLHYLGPRVHPIPPWLRCLLAKEDKQFLRQKSLLIPAAHREPKSGSMKRSHHVLISHQNMRSPQSYCTSVHDMSAIRMNVLDNSSSNTLVPGAGNTTTSSCLEEDECSSTESVSNENSGNGGGGGGGGGGGNEGISSGGGGGGRYPKQRHHVHHHHHNLNNRAYPLRNNPLMNTNNSPVQSVNKEDALRVGGVGLAIQEELLRSIQYLIKKQEDVEFQNVLVAEWRLVAQVVDRILFWIFFLVTLVSSAIFLLILPFYKRSWQGPIP